MTGVERARRGVGVCMPVCVCTHLCTPGHILSGLAGGHLAFTGSEVESCWRVLNKGGCKLTYIINNRPSLCLKIRMPVAMMAKGVKHGNSSYKNQHPSF